MLKDQDKSYLLKLARQSLDYFFENGEEYHIDETSLPKELKINASSIITLKMNGNLRGCIGTLVSSKYLYNNVVSNTYSAAFSDPRFKPISKEDLESLSIEISLISKANKVEYDSIGELLSILNLHKPGVTFKFGRRGSTFLPEMWETIQDPFIFMNELCKKAGFQEDFWLYNKLNLHIFWIEEFGEY